MGFMFFILFAVVILTSYITVRRRLAPPRVTAVVSMLGCIITMTLYLLTERQATKATYNVILGVVAGATFSALALGMAWFFQSLETRPDAATRKNYLPQDDPRNESK